MPLRRMALLLLALILIRPAAYAPTASAQDTAPVVIGVTDFPRTLDPANAPDFPSWELLYHLYTGLTRQLPDNVDYELALAADHTVSEDGLTHTFTVRDDAAFDDGTPITAETFVRSIQRVLDLQRGSETIFREYITNVEAGEDNSVVFTLNHPIPDVEALVALPIFFPVHPDIYPTGEVINEDTLGTLISNGSYRLDSFASADEVRLSPNPNYNGPDAATGPITLRYYRLPIDLREALLNGEVDIAWRALAQPDREVVAAQDGLTLLTEPSLQMFYLLLYQRSGGCSIGGGQNAIPYDDPAVRQGIALLLDRQRAAENGFAGMASAMYNIVPSEFTGAPDSYPPFNPALAEQILFDAGYRRLRNTVNVLLAVSSGTYGNTIVNAAQELQRAMQVSEIAAVGGVQDSQDATAFERAVNRGELCSPIIGWNPLYASPAGYLMPLLYSDSLIPTNYHYGNSEIDDLLLAAAQANDPGAQAEIYRQIETLVAEADMLIPLWQGTNTIAYRQGLEGVVVEANGWLRYNQLHLASSPTD